MILHSKLSDIEVKQLIKNKTIQFGGNRLLKIYGLLTCVSGKRMQKKNRVFFNTISEAEKFGFRPCGNCMKQAYLIRKTTQSL
jgi:methylphosphotriester-DNA--protein-cysteine methyltransferase